MSAPLISVIIPVYNGEKYLAEAIESVLAQDKYKMEIIIVDDGSTDGTAAVARRFAGQVRYLYQSNRGVSGARNGGLEIAEGSIFAFLDSDDLWTKDKISLQMEALESDTALDMVFGYVRQFFSPDLDEIMKQKIVCPQENMPGYHPGAMLVRRNAFLDVGLFDEKLGAGEFLDWYYRAQGKKYRSLLIPQVVMKRRIHAANRGILVRDVRPDYLRVLKAALDRRRKNPGDVVD